MADNNALSRTKVASIIGKGGAKKKLVTANGGTGNCQIYLQHKGQLYQPITASSIEWETERKGSPGKLTFTVYQDGKLAYDYGDTIIFKYLDGTVFYGYLFRLNPDSDGLIQMTAYDQLRYLKNKHTYVYKNKRLDQLVRMIADDFNLRCGELSNTGYKVSRVEDNNALFDIIQNASDDTVLATGKLYCLYDDAGRLMLKNVSELKTDVLIDEDTAQSYDYTGSIDDATYNKIQVYYDDNGTRVFVIAQDGKSQSQYGVLQLTEKAASKGSAKEQAKAMLDMYNAPTRALSVKNVFGNTKVRAGCYVPVMLQLADIKISNYMMVETAKHTWTESEYTMDLKLIGNTFTG